MRRTIKGNERPCTKDSYNNLLLERIKKTVEWTHHYIFLGDKNVQPCVCNIEHLLTILLGLVNGASVYEDSIVS